MSKKLTLLLRIKRRSSLLRKAMIRPMEHRPLRRAIQKHIEDRLSEDLLIGKIAKGDSLIIDEKDGELSRPEHE